MAKVSEIMLQLVTGVEQEPVEVVAVAEVVVVEVVEVISGAIGSKPDISLNNFFNSRSSSLQVSRL